MKLDATATQTGGSTDGELASTIDAEIDVVQAQPVAIVSLSDIDGEFTSVPSTVGGRCRRLILLGLQPIAIGHCGSRHATIRIEGGDGLHTLASGRNRREATVVGVFELFNSCAATEAATARQMTCVVEEIVMTLEIGYTAVVGERVGASQRHNFTLVVPGAKRRGGGAVADVLRYTASGVEEQPRTRGFLYEPRSFDVGILIFLALLALASDR